MRRKINNLISVAYTLIRFVIIKCFHFSGFKFELIERFSPNVVVEIDRKGKLFLGKKVRVHSGTKIKVRRNAECVIGENAKLNYNNIIVCRQKIIIGKGVEFAPNVFIYDHDHDFRAEGGLKANKMLCEEIVIGDNVWIGANCVILRGTHIGDNSVVAAGSIIKGNYPPNSLIVQKRNTEILKVSNQ